MVGSSRYYSFRAIKPWWNGYCRLIHPAATAVTADLYIQQLQRVHQSLLKKRPALVNRKNVVLLHDNTRPHTAGVTQEKHFEPGLSSLPHHTHLTFRLLIIIFLDHCNSLMVTNFSNEDQVREFVKNFFTSKLAEFYAKGIEELPDEWQRVIANDGKYVTY